MMPFIDTHCHVNMILERTGQSPELFFEQLDPAPEAIIQVACHPADFNWSKELLLRKELSGVKIYGAFGVHPLDVKNYSEQAEAEILENLKLPGVVAFGEIGLDYHYEGFNAALQKKVFLRQLEIGLKTGLPIILHMREAEDDIFEILQNIDSKDIRAHIHCYTGTLDFMQKVLSLKGNYFFGVTGALTFDKTVNIREVVAAIPLNRILLETDAPYLAPVPFRGKTCTPAMIPNIAQVLAKVKNTSIDEVFRITRENTKAMYGV
ncbi:MAG: TatD family hydrolase [Fibromonadaceae bacterium]|jgi:TatD DNase family protein|nr:TatD family hydrolase [Fibromonadaceae bacterium]